MDRIPEHNSNSNSNAVKRPPEMEDWLNAHLFHPLSLRLAKALSGTFVSPNMVSIAGGVMILCAAASIAIFSPPIGGLLALVALTGWHVLDGADGDLARMTGRESAFGEVVDGICDYAGHVVLYLVLGVWLAQQIGPLGWGLMASTGLARIVQANFYESQRRQYQSWVYGKPWLGTRQSEQLQTSGAMEFLSNQYMVLSGLLTAKGEALDRRFDAMGAKELEAARRLAKTRLAPLIRLIMPLSANYRSIVIALAAVAASPVLVVIFELVLLSLFLIYALARAKRSISQLLEEA